MDRFGEISMKNEVKDFIIKLLEKKRPISKDIDIDSLEYFKTGHVDSLGLMKFILEIEEKFNIEISEEDMMDESFGTVDGVVDIVSRKCLLSNKMDK